MGKDQQLKSNYQQQSYLRYQLSLNCGSLPHGYALLLAQVDKTVKSRQQSQSSSSSTSSVRKAKRNGTNGKDQQQEQKSQQDLSIAACEKHLKLASRNDNNSKGQFGLDMSGMRLFRLGPSIYSYAMHLQVLNLGHNQFIEFPSAILQLKQLRVLDLSANQIRQIPFEIYKLGQLVEFWIFDNSLADIPVTIGLLPRLQFLGVEGNQQLNRIYVDMLYRLGTEGLVAQLRDSLPQELLIPYKYPVRRWIQISPARQDPFQASFRVITFNILSERYAKMDRYWHSPQSVVDFKYRWSRIEFTLRALSQDYRESGIIICLQEIESSVWQQRILGGWIGAESTSFVCAHQMQEGDAQCRPLQFEDSLWDGIFMPKSRWRFLSVQKRYNNVPSPQTSSSNLQQNSNDYTNTAPNNSKGNDNRLPGSDGCSILWNTQFFQRLDMKPFTAEFSRLALNRNDFVKSDILFQRFVSKDNIAVGCVLQSMINRDKFIFVVNVHIHWDPQFADVKFVQTVMLLDEMKKYYQLVLQKFPHIQDIDIVLTGDFNSLPTSLVYAYVTSSDDDGVSNIGEHKDMAPCFSDTSPPVKVKSTDSISTQNEVVYDGQGTDEISNLNIVDAIDSDDEVDPDTESQQLIKKFRSWKESDYGRISSRDACQHHLGKQLLSAYRSVEDRDVTADGVVGLPFTNHTDSFTGAIDYIFHSDSLHLERVLGGYLLHKDQSTVKDINPDAVAKQDHVRLAMDHNQETTSLFMMTNTLRQNGPLDQLQQQQLFSIEGVESFGFPNYTFPSDHIPLCAEFRLI
ncbi:hypothetical protein MIR68_005684 [Amoeboaphelidium protococcarum]|nr:hypothetical protein MIR68_005684 [Amoeboaphelidium protococcarum]